MLQNCKNRGNNHRVDIQQVTIAPINIDIFLVILTVIKFLKLGMSPISVFRIVISSSIIIYGYLSVIKTMV